jgi:hypothetical protein
MANDWTIFSVKYSAFIFLFLNQNIDDNFSCLIDENNHLVFFSACDAGRTSLMFSAQIAHTIRM